MEKEQDKELVIAGLIEANDILVEQANRLRNNNRVLRTVIRQLRSANAELRQSQAIAAENDGVLKAFFQGEFDAPVSTEAQGGLPAASV